MTTVAPCSWAERAVPEHTQVHAAVPLTPPLSALCTGRPHRQPEHRLRGGGEVPGHPQDAGC